MQTSESILLPSSIVRIVSRFRDDEFSVGSVFESDVIHANKKDIACIFRVSRRGSPVLLSMSMAEGVFEKYMEIRACGANWRTRYVDNTCIVISA